MKAIAFLCFIALISVNGITDTHPEVDQCHTAFDLGGTEGHAVEMTVSAEKILGLGKAYISYNNCTNERESRIYCNTYRLIIAPTANPASLITINGEIPERFHTDILGLESGDRVILEGLNYTLDNETINLKPIVFTIE